MPSSFRLRAMQKAIVDADSARVRLLLRSGVPPQGAFDGTSFLELAVLDAALRMAAVGGNPEVVTMLLARGADPNGRCETFEDTPLQNAEREQHPAVIAILQNAGAVER